MSANAVVLVPPMAAVISTAWTACVMVGIFIFWSSTVLDRRRGGVHRPRTRSARTQSAPGRRSGQGSRGLVGRWTVQAVAEDVVRDQVRGPDPAPQRQRADR